MKAGAVVLVMLASTVHSSGNYSATRPQFGDDCAGASSCCAKADDGVACTLVCTTLNSKLSSCSAPCSSTADCRLHGEELQCIQVAGEEQLEQRDVSFAMAVVIGASVLGVLALGYCALLRGKEAGGRRDLCAACASLTAAAAVAVVVSGHSAEPSTHHFHSDARAVSANETHVQQRFCAPNGLLWVVGVSMTLAGSVAITLGTQLQKLAFNRQERAWQEALAAAALAATRGEGRAFEPAPRKPWFKLPLWWVGFLFLVIGAVSDFAAVGFAAQSLLAPLAAASLIINSIQAPCLLGEVPTLFDMLATLVICVGCTVSVVFADHTTRTYSLDDMLVLLVRPPFCTYLVSLLVLMVYAATVICRAQHDVQTVRIPAPHYLAAEAKSFADTDSLLLQVKAMDDDALSEKHGTHSRIAAKGAKHVRTDSSQKNGNVEEETVQVDAIERSRLAGSNYYAVYYAVLAGQCGGLTMLFAKMFSEIVRTVVTLAYWLRIIIDTDDAVTGQDTGSGWWPWCRLAYAGFCHTCRVACDMYD